jgi:hypothetical protein
MFVQLPPLIAKYTAREEKTLALHWTTMISVEATSCLELMDFWTCSSFGIVEIRKHNVSET